jgi:hypothetical protein
MLRMFRKKLVVIALLCITNSSFAQQIRFDFPKADLATKNTIVFPSQQSSFLTKYPVVSILSFQKRKLPFFCNMEEKLHKRFNIWIVLRAGSEEQYRKFLTQDK